MNLKIVIYLIHFFSPVTMVFLQSLYQFNIFKHFYLISRRKYLENIKICYVQDKLIVKMIFYFDQIPIWEDNFAKYSQGIWLPLYHNQNFICPILPTDLSSSLEQVYLSETVGTQAFSLWHF